MPLFNSNVYPTAYPYQTTYYQPTQPVYTPQTVVPTPAPTVQQPSSIIWISGDKEAAMYPVAPNAAVTLWSQSEPVVYLKQADAAGKPTMKVYDLVERVDTSGAEKKEDFATKTDLAAVVGVVKDFDTVIASIKNEIETMRGDLYGLAGKKKITKTSEGDET